MIGGYCRQCIVWDIMPIHLRVCLQYISSMYVCMHLFISQCNYYVSHVIQCSYIRDEAAVESQTSKAENHVFSFYLPYLENDVIKQS